MNSTDLVTIIGNISQSLAPVQRLITGLSYLLGILFFMTAISKFKKIGDYRTQSSSQEKMFTPLMYLFFGSALLYLPSALSVMANTAFGVGNVLTYANDYKPGNIFSSMGFFIRTAGIIWFVRGCTLLAHAGEPGTQEGPKGLVFLVAGVLAMNFDNTVSIVNTIITYLISWSLAVKSYQGF